MKLNTINFIEYITNQQLFATKFTKKKKLSGHGQFNVLSRDSLIYN